MEYTDEVLKAYKFRFACRDFDKNKKISDENFKVILEAGRLSPSSFGLEPWRFLVINNIQIRNKLKEVAPGAATKLENCSHFLIVLSKKDLSWDSDYANYIFEHIQKKNEEQCSIQIENLKIFQEKIFGLANDSAKIFEWTSRQSYIALSNMLSSAAQLGIDSCPIEGFYKEKVEKLLAEESLLDEDEYGVSVMIAFGYRVREPISKYRRTLAEIVQWV